ncbi:MAG: NAD(+) synthase [Kiritimatiellia bacterium]
MKDFVRVAAAVPCVRPADVAGNLASIRRVYAEAVKSGARAIVFPELCLTGYTCADLFYQPSLLSAAERALGDFIAFVQSMGSIPRLIALGLPVRHQGRIFNCAAIISDGGLVGIVPKTYLPSTREFYETRWFASALEATATEVTFCGKTVPFGNDLIFDTGAAVYGVELCEDMWAANPPSTRLTLRGANVILNLSGSNELIGKTDYRRALVVGQSARCLAAYVYAGAGVGESTTDLVFGGHTLIAENGALLAEGERFVRGEHLTQADVDVGFLEFERTASAAYRQAARIVPPVRRIACGGARDEAADATDSTLLRRIDPHPFVPAADADRNARCAEILAIQSTGLATRLAAIGGRDVVVGLSGGLDSALALLVCVEAFDRLGFDRKGIHAFTLPGFGTTRRTKGNAELLCEGLGVPLETIDITPMARQHLKDLGRDESVKDITYENTQARGRTYLLMDKANQLGGLVIGTGDLSEFALGWCTYNGDHMSMYGVNAGVPKTLVRYIVRWYAEERLGEGAAARALVDILATPVSPELLPAREDGTIAQVTEDKVGPYELHDFFLYHFLRRGAAKEKIARLANVAFAGVYAADVIAKWLDVFFMRFYRQQFKRSCMPDGPKVGSLNLSPRGDWRMPSDAVLGGGCAPGANGFQSDHLSISR